MPDMNPENNRDTFQGRGVQIQQYKDALEKTKKNMMEMERDLYLKINELEKQNEEMKELLKTIYETDCLRDWTFEDDDGNSIADKVRKIVKETK